ncbi:MAG TPA: GPW/gp25 family protein [Trebonia sp.]|nr:GPW/gp25 family protein [Trebonia sp.]
MSDIAFPFAVDRRGRTAEADYAPHVRQMIELLLFTAPGERVMRPDFGCGLLDLTFEPNSPELAATLQISIQGQLQRWLGDVITAVALDVTSEDDVLRITISYVVRATGGQATETFLGARVA